MYKDHKQNNYRQNQTPNAYTEKKTSQIICFGDPYLTQE